MPLFSINVETVDTSSSKALEPAKYASSLAIRSITLLNSVGSARSLATVGLYPEFIALASSRISLPPTL